MDAGLIIYNNHGTIQLNATSRALGFHSKVTIAGWTSLGGFWVDIYPTPFTTLAVHLGSPCTYTWRQDLGGGLWRYYFAGPVGAETYDVYRFELMAMPEPSSFGFQVFNAAGECCFDAAQRPIVVAGVVGPTAGTLAIPTGRKYACITMSRFYAVSYTRWTDDVYWYQSSTTRQARFWFTPGLFNYDPAVVLEGGSAIIDPAEPQPADYVSGEPIFHIIDVTGY